eukprot:4992389-Amphidinium_carterae.1
MKVDLKNFGRIDVFWCSNAKTNVLGNPIWGHSLMIDVCGPAVSDLSLAATATMSRQRHLTHGRRLNALVCTAP